MNTAKRLRMGQVHLLVGCDLFQGALTKHEDVSAIYREFVFTTRQTNPSVEFSPEMMLHPVAQKAWEDVVLLLEEKGIKLPFGELLPSSEERSVVGVLDLPPAPPEQNFVL